MNPISQILWEAAADVERRGVTRPPVASEGETCAAVALAAAVERNGMDKWYWTDCGYAWIRDLLGAGLYLSHWNDAQPSRAVVAAAMRDAAFLAEWAGPHLLLGGSK